jgi:hypothetical protein
MHPSARFRSVPAFAVLVLASVACRTPQPATSTAGLTLQVRRVSLDAARTQLDLVVRVTNDQNAELTFEQEKVVLLVGEREVPVKARVRAGEVTRVAPRRAEDCRWVFAVGEGLAASHTVLLRDARVGGDLTNETPNFEVLVPPPK